MSALNWGMISDGGVFESLMHAILYAEEPSTVLFGRPGRDAGQDARSPDGAVVYQAKYRQGLVMDGAVDLALEELEKIKDYRQSGHANHPHWRDARTWVLVANFSINPNDHAKWQNQVLPVFQREGLAAEYWHIDILEGKLTQHSEVRDVFFGGENRVLVGLKEAHDLLASECVGSASLDVDVLGRDGEVALIRDFAAAGDKRVLPVVGPGGIGKSRLLYEGLITLSQDGWRVLWALPGSMSRSSQWFRLLNGAQQTCVAIDAPDDPGLLRAVIEQLATVERRNWRVIIATRTEKAEVLRRYRNHNHVHEPVELAPLDEPTSQRLVNACLGGQAPPPWLHSVYGFTHGVPGWLCLIAELAKTGALSELPTSADEVAGVYLDSCLSALGDPRREQGVTLLRWLALWGTLRVESGTGEQAEISFLETQGLPSPTARDLLTRLVDTGLVRNWGVGKRLFAIEPLIVRQQILAGWLLRESAGAYEVSDEGTALVIQLVKGQVPAVDSALSTLSQLARTRLAEPEATLFMGPIFSAMATIAQDGNVLDQYRVADLVEKAGAADPESALDVLAAIRENAKESMNVEVANWGEQSFTHGALVANLPWTLFEIAERASDQIVARRYIEEFRRLIALEDADALKASAGKGPRQLFKRLLCESKNSEAYAQPAHDLAVEELTAPASWPFVGLVAECLLNPIRESTDWVANWTITLTRRAFAQGSTEWNLAADLRERAFAALRDNPEPAFRAPLWRVLAESHHSFNRAVLHGNVTGPNVPPYRALLTADLTACAAILTTPPVALSVEEATAAREMWKWHLQYGREDDPVELARQCEQIYNGLPTSRWRLHDFFQFETEDELAPETARVAAAFRDASGLETVAEFFDAAKQYLDAARQGREDMADDWRVSDLADACADQLALGIDPPGNAVTAFVREVLSQPDPGQGNTMAWGFAVRLCRRHLFAIKSEGDAAVEPGLTTLLDMTAAKSRLLWGLYGNVHPATTGTLTRVELDCILSHEAGFSLREWFSLLGAFSAVDAQGVQDRLRSCLDTMRDDPMEASQCLGRFIRSVHITGLRYDWTPSQLPVAWIIDMITAFGLDGVLLGMHDLEWLRDQAGFRLSMVRLTALIRSRIELEQQPKPGDRFEILPHDFTVGAWTVFDAGDPAEVEAFSEFCQMALGRSFTALYWMPKYIVQLDPSGQQVGDYVTRHLADNPDIDGDALARLGYLASAYPDDSDAWASIARPICLKAQTCRREDRQHVYFGLTKKETGVLRSMPGQVPDYYVQRRDSAACLLEAESQISPLSPYREWVLRCAEEDLRREEGRAEEDAHE
jgi:hypothetical protein